MVRPDGTIGFRNIGWTSYANMVYVEAPPGVGFSYSNDTSFSPGDHTAAKDNYEFIKGFFAAFPEYNGRGFYVSGESYGGVYVPTVVQQITNQGSSSSLYQNLKGFLVGNPVMNCDLSSDTNSLVEPFYWKGAVSYKDYSDWHSNNCDQDESGSTCQDILNNINNGVGQSVQEAARNKGKRSPLPSWDPDNIYQNFVIDNGTLSIVNYQVPAGGYTPVLTDYLSDYLSKTSVQTAIHVAPFLVGNIQWSPCANINYNADEGSLVPVYQSIIAAKPGIKIMVYSGDEDVATCPFFSTDRCLGLLKDTRTRPWGPWFVNSGTAGYWEQYQTYTRAFIKGSGHEAPYYQPVAAQEMFRRFIQNGNLLDPNGNARPMGRQRLTQGQILRAMMRERGQRP